MKKSYLGPLEVTVSIATLKAKLAQYLRIAKAGGTVTVTDHNMPVAIIESARREYEPLKTIKAKGSFSDLLKTVKIPPQEKTHKVTSLEILMEDRKKR